jgi:hypothetical protein
MFVSHRNAFSARACSWDGIFGGDRTE